MRLCPLSDLQPGMLLGKSLFTEKGQLLLRAGYTLDTDVLRRIAANGRKAIYVFEEGTEDIIPLDIISDEARGRAAATFSDTIDKVADAVKVSKDIPPEKLRAVLQRGAEFRNVVDVDRVSAEVATIVDEIVDSSTDVLNQTLMKSRVGYNTEHAVDTALVALLIGRRLQYSRRDLVELGTGAFLHDLGKLALPTLLEKSPADLTEAERAALYEHPVFGQQLLSNSTDRFFMAQTTILHHHERQDGMGYPLGLEGKNVKPVLDGRDASRSIFPFAEIVSVADAYDNLISHRGNSTPPDQAIREIMRRARSAFNLVVAALLADVISIFPIGSMVRIAECSAGVLQGAQGAIMKTNNERPHQPLLVLLRNAHGLKITPKTIDLAGERYARLELVH
jgi:HD-GYP domain-containing protein (c-di-GMP phosphodiesterase class II)